MPAVPASPASGSPAQAHRRGYPASKVSFLAVFSGAALLMAGCGGSAAPASAGSSAVAAAASPGSSAPGSASASHAASAPGSAATSNGAPVSVSPAGSNAAPASGSGRGRSPAAPASGGLSASASAASSGGAAAASAGAGASTKITVSYSELAASDLQAYMAQDGGYFQKNGLNVDLRLIPSATGVAALISGETQIAQLGGSEALAADVGGADLVVTATLSPVFPYTFEVAPAIKTKQDLIGKKVGVSKIGSSSDTALRAGLVKFGITPDKDVTVLAVGSRSAQTAAAISGSVQGELTHPPDSLDLEAHGWHQLFDLSALGLPSANTTIVANRAWLKGHTEVMQKYVDSVVQAEARAKKDPAFAKQVLGKYLKLSDAHALQITYDYYVGHVLAVVPYPKPEQFSGALTELADKKAKVKGFDVSTMLDGSYAKSAADRGLDKS